MSATADPPPHGLIHPQQRNLFIKSSTFKIIAAVIALSFVGCADLERKFATSDGLIDFILAVSGYGQIDAYPAERISRGEGEIITAHARKDSRGAFVFGDVGKRYGADWVTTAWSHVDVIVLDQKPASQEPCN